MAKTSDAAEILRRRFVEGKPEMEALVRKERGKANVAQQKTRDTRTARTGKAVPQAYLALLEQFLLRPLRNDRDWSKAVAMVDALASRTTPLVAMERHYFEVLCQLIERYEEETVSMPDVGAADMLRFLIDQRGVTPQTAAMEAGIAPATLLAVLNGSRGLTRKHVELLATYFGVALAVFLLGNE